MKTFRPVQTIQGVVSGGIATADLPIGFTYHGILFTMGGTSFELSDITQIRVMGNGKTMFTVSGADLDAINLFKGRSAASSQFYLDFERYGLDTAVGATPIEALRGRELTAIGTGVRVSEQNPIELTTLQIQLDIATTATAPTLSASAHQSGPRSLGLLLKRRRFSYFPSGSGEFEISDLPRGDLIDAIYIKSAGDYITKVVMERDNFLAFERTPAMNSHVQRDGVRVPQDNWFVIDPSERGRGDEAIVSAGVQDFRLKITVSQADTLTVYVDYLGALTGN